MDKVFISHGEIAYENTLLIGVFDNLEDAVERCRERTHADEAGDWPFDRHWVEEWEINGRFLRQHDVIEGGVFVSDEAVPDEAEV